jgi:hypothetical protein
MREQMPEDNTAATATREAPAPRRTAIAAALASVVTLAGQVPGLVDDEGRELTVEWDFERPADWATMQRVQQATAGAAEAGETVAFATLKLVAADVRGLPDFEPRGEGEAAESFRARWAEYFGVGCDLLLVPLWHAYSRETFPDVGRASFRGKAPAL